MKTQVPQGERELQWQRMRQYAIESHDRWVREETEKRMKAHWTARVAANSAKSPAKG
ncbi:MAG: hypothetical protein ACRCUY_02860 [Thermoguttaceae bacterium]